MARLIVATYLPMRWGSDRGSQPWARDRHQKQNRALKGGLGLTGLHLLIHSGVERGYVPTDIMDRCIREVTCPRSLAQLLG
jgi:hypothetical protein